MIDMALFLDTVAYFVDVFVMLFPPRVEGLLLKLDDRFVFLGTSLVTPTLPWDAVPKFPPLEYW